MLATYKSLVHQKHYVTWESLSTRVWRESEGLPMQEYSLAVGYSSRSECKYSWPTLTPVNPVTKARLNQAISPIEFVSKQYNY